MKHQQWTEGIHSSLVRNQIIFRRFKICINGISSCILQIFPGKSGFVSLCPLLSWNFMASFGKILWPFLRKTPDRRTEMGQSIGPTYVGGSKKQVSERKIAEKQCQHEIVYLWRYNQIFTTNITIYSAEMYRYPLHSEQTWEKTW